MDTITADRSSLTDFTELTYAELKVLNTTNRAITDPREAERTHVEYLKTHPGFRAVMVCFADVNGTFHTLDYDAEFFVKSLGNLTFDGSSILGFSAQNESDLRLVIDWRSFTLLPADVFGAGKALVFANVRNRDGSQFAADFRGRLDEYARAMFERDGTVFQMAPEVEGMLFQGREAERFYTTADGFKPVGVGSYFSTLPLAPLREFINLVAAAIRAMGFINEKDHAEVAQAQFEINWSYTEALRACDQVLLYKLVCRQIADTLGYTACFLPKPLARVNGNGQHTNISLSKDGVNLFSNPAGRLGLSQLGWQFIYGILHHAEAMSLIWSSSVSAYRRMGKEFEAPDEIIASGNNRGAVIRVPHVDVESPNSTRLEVRAVAPDCNPYLLVLALLAAGLDTEVPQNLGDEQRFLPHTIGEAIAFFEASDFIRNLLGEAAMESYLTSKKEDRDRAPAKLGKRIKEDEVLLHHSVRDQASEF